MRLIALYRAAERESYRGRDALKSSGFTLLCQVSTVSKLVIVASDLGGFQSIARTLFRGRFDGTAYGCGGVVVFSRTIDGLTLTSF